MPETVRQQLVNKNLDALRTILVANGFETDLGLKVHEWRSTPFASHEVPALVFRDLDEPLIEPSANAKRVNRQLHCMVQVIVTDDVPMTLIRKILADIEKAIGVGAEGNWNELATNTRPRISRALLEQDSFKVAGSTFEYYIEYPTTAFNSYA